MGGNAEQSPSLPISVILPVRNGGTYLAEQLEALANQSYRGDWELLVVDNGSTDSTREVAKSFTRRFRSLRFLDASTNPGAAYARNVGAKCSDGEFLLYVDADDRVREHWLSAMSRAAQSHDVVGGSLVAFHVDSTGRAIFEGGPITELPRLRDTCLPYAIGANCGVRAKALRDVGGWDKRFLAEEEVDLFWRLQLAGNDLVFVPDAVVEYRLRPDFLTLWSQHFRYGRFLPLLHQKFGDEMIPPPPPRVVIRRLKGVLASTPNSIRSRVDRRVSIIHVATRSRLCARQSGVRELLRQHRLRIRRVRSPTLLLLAARP